MTFDSLGTEAVSLAARSVVTASRVWPVADFAGAWLSLAVVKAISLAVSELGNVAKLIGVPVRELRSLPRRIQENICGAYTMEYDVDSTNIDLIDHIREKIAQ